MPAAVDRGGVAPPEALAPRTEDAAMVTATGKRADYALTDHDDAPNCAPPTAGFPTTVAPPSRCGLNRVWDPSPLICAPRYPNPRR